MKLIRQTTAQSVEGMPFCGMAFGRLLATLVSNGSTLALVALCCVWLFLVILANPVGEFPLNDDWSYSRAVQNLVEQGHLELTGFTSMPLLAQVFWGALFTLPFGFSFTAMRLSAVALGLAGMITTFRLVEEGTRDRLLALFAASVVGANPLYFNLALTFMTDVPFFTLSMLSFLFLLRALRAERKLDLAAGIACSGAAIFIRQLGILIPLSFAVAYYAKRGSGRKTLQNAFIPAIIMLAGLLAYPVVLQHTIGLPVLYNRSYEPILESAPLGSLQLLEILADRLLVEWIYVGLFLLPFSILILPQLWQRSSACSKRLMIVSSTALFVAVLSILLWQGRAMPLTGNIWFDLGLGPALLRDAYVLRLPHLPAAPAEFWSLVTGAAILGSVLLATHLWAVVVRTVQHTDTESSIEHVQAIFCLSAAALYTVLIAMTGFLDRYLIFPLPLLMIAAGSPKCLGLVRGRVLPLSLAVAILCLFSIFALAGTHDYLAWNRARWQALNDLMEREHVSYRNIDGGFEFNGWYGYDPNYRQNSTQSWWWVDQDDYVIAFGAIPGFEPVKHYSYERWMPLGPSAIFVLQRAAGEK